MPSIWELDIEDITAERIEQLVNDQQSETIRLEFKRELNLKKESEKREAGKDVAAFANAEGGLLIYGVEEKVLDTGRRVAGATRPLTEENLADRLTDTLHNRIDPRPEFRVQTVPAGDAGWYLVVKIEASYYELHAVLDRASSMVATVASGTRTSASTAWLPSERPSTFGVVLESAVPRSRLLPYEPIRNSAFPIRITIRSRTGERCLRFRSRYLITTIAGSTTAALWLWRS